jgi:hypothetical protein
MIDLIKQLNTHFCEELNTAWLKSVSESSGRELNTTIFSDIKNLIAEAKDQGYRFNLDYSPDLFFEERIMDKKLEREFCALPEWNEMGVILGMIKKAETNRWDSVLPHFKELKKQHLRPIMLQYAINCSKQYGPFFAGQDNETINVFGFCGTVIEDMVLISMLYPNK